MVTPKKLPRNRTKTLPHGPQLGLIKFHGGRKGWWGAPETVVLSSVVVFFTAVALAVVVVLVDVVVAVAAVVVADVAVAASVLLVANV